VLALQGASVIGVADRYAQATRRPALVNPHTAAGSATRWAISLQLSLTAPR
jgi:benzoylformate decarboxylase